MLDVVIYILVIIIIIILLNKYGEPSYSRYGFASAISKSAGVWDASAAQAYENITRVENPTPYDEYLAGNVLDDYLLRADITPQLRDPLVRTIEGFYTRALQHSVAGQMENQERLIPLSAIARMEAFQREFMFAPIEAVIADAGGPMHANAGDVARSQSETRARELAQTEARNAPTKSAKTEVFLREMVDIRDDRQNVHDSAVVGDLRKTCDYLRARYKIGSVPAVARGLDSKNPDCVRVLAQLQESPQTISAFGGTDADLLTLVYARIQDPENAESRAEMMRALEHSLADCVENGTTVCSTGRASRILGSLAVLDAEPQLGAAKTVEMYRAQIYAEVKKLIDSAAEDALKSSDPELVAVGRSYVDPTVRTTSDAEDLFKATVSNRISAHVATYANDLPPQEIQKITDDCVVAI